MLHVMSTKFDKNRAVLTGVTLQLNPIEHRIFSLIQDAIDEMPQRPTVRICGGWVRDKLLGIESDDIDITVDNMSGEDFVQSLDVIAKRRFGHESPIRILNANFETSDEQVKRIAAGQISIYGQQIDVVSLRKESWTDPTTGEQLVRNPIVVEGTPAEDAFRRDLTINSMFYRINDGQIEDFAGGYSDLMSMTLRTPAIPEGYEGGKPPNVDPMEWQYTEAMRVFTEDPVRLLRVLRFYSRYPKSHLFGYKPEKSKDGPIVRAMRNPKVQQLLTDKLRDTSAKGIVAEKNAKEFLKILGGERPADAVRVMWKTGLLGSLLNLPEDFSPLDMDQRNKWHDQTVIEHTLAVLKNMNQISRKYKLEESERMMLNLSSLFHDLGKLDPRAQKVKPDGTLGYYGNPKRKDKLTHQQSSMALWVDFAKRMKLSNQVRDFVRDVVIQHMKPHDHVENRKPSTLAEFKDLNPRWKFIYMHAMADAMSKGSKPEPDKNIPYGNMIDQIEKIELPMLLTGNEIMTITGLPPGPVIGEILKAIRKCQYENMMLPELPPLEQQKEKAKQVALSFVPDPINRRRIQDIVYQRIGLRPGQPPMGMQSWPQMIRDRLKEERVANPAITDEEAKQIVHQMIEEGELEGYRT